MGMGFLLPIFKSRSGNRSLIVSRVESFTEKERAVTFYTPATTVDAAIRDTFDGDRLTTMRATNR